MGLPYSLFKQRHPNYDSHYWKKCRALYAGGKKLLGDKKLLEELLPAHSDEEEELYEERKRRAYYIPYAGEIIDAIVASLTDDPISFTSEPQSNDEFYTRFYKNVTDSHEPKPFEVYLKEQMQTALICKTAWTMVDFPKMEMEAKTRGEQEESGALDAYLCQLTPESVVDWEEDDDGCIEWVLIRDVKARRSSLSESRNVVRETFRHITEDSWAVYEIAYDKSSPPGDDDLVTLVDSGVNSFGRVPIARLDLSDGLWAMGKIESIAVAHFNKRNALSWAEYCSLFPVPVAYLGPSDPLNPLSDDESRAASQKHGPGYLRVMADKDRMEYFGPDSSPFSIASADLDKLRDEMHRVLYQMALSVDNSGAALQRSAESKAIDRATAAVVLGALGGYLRRHAEAIMSLVAEGRHDAEQWAAHGMESFDDTTLGQQLNEALMLETIQLPSATFQAKYKYALAKKLLGADATDQELVNIKKELESNITQERVDEQAQMMIDERAAKAAGKVIGGQDNISNVAKAAGKVEDNTK